MSIYFIILGVGANPSNIHRLPVDEHYRYYSVLVSFDIKNNPVVADYIHRIGYLF
jgi:hypothetical protein